MVEELWKVCGIIVPPSGKHDTWHDLSHMRAYLHKQQHIIKCIKCYILKHLNNLYLPKLSHTRAAAPHWVKNMPFISSLFLRRHEFPRVRRITAPQMKTVSYAEEMERLATKQPQES